MSCREHHLKLFFLTWHAVPRGHRSIATALFKSDFSISVKGAVQHSVDSRGLPLIFTEVIGDSPAGMWKAMSSKEWNLPASFDMVLLSCMECTCRLMEIMLTVTFQLRAIRFEKNTVKSVYLFGCFQHFLFFCTETIVDELQGHFHFCNMHLNTVILLVMTILFIIEVFFFTLQELKRHFWFHFLPCKFLHTFYLGVGRGVTNSKYL